MQSDTHLPHIDAGATTRLSGPNRAGQPLYAVVKEGILRRIRSRELPAGARVPSEHEIVRDFGVSRMTANRALRELMAEGVVTRIAGVGSFVASQPVRGEMLEIRSIADEIAARGHVHSCRIIAREARPATQLVAEALDLALGSPVLHTKVLHLEGETPIQIEERYVNPAVAPNYLAVDFSLETAHAYLSRIAPITSFEHVIEAVLPDATARRLLHLRRTQPCLRLFRRTWSDNVPVTCAWLLHSAAMYTVRATRNVPLGADASSSLGLP